MVLTRATIKNSCPTFSNSKAASLMVIFNISEISLMGFVEIIPHIFRLKKLLKQTYFYKSSQKDYCWQIMRILLKYKLCSVTAVHIY